MSHSLTRRLAELEGAEAALVLASGRAAVACTALALLRPGDHLLAGSALQASTRAFFTRELPALGTEVTYVDPREPRGWRRGLQRTTRALFVESPVIDSGRLVDLRPPRTLANELGTALIVDATGASPVNFTPLAHGADVVLHDATAFIEPHGKGEVGIVAGTEALVEEVRLKMKAWGADPHPAAYAQLERGLATLEVRVHHQNSVALQVAQWAGTHPQVSGVVYAGLPDHPDQPLLAEWFKGAGALVLLQLQDGHDPARVSAHATARLREGVEPTRVSTRFLAQGETGWLRVEVGLEPAEHLADALAAALAVAASSPA
ncbi:MAG: PLP-dependent transferase [Gemmatimonas sp.]|uniref:PLP-dependent transferase n=1 Tax=Gemmatimonas sp. TaxID=1962908 RepID=UPI0022BAC9D8|nr:PLP-dependent transferase [Gemmatimonas sp.]MCE2952791.1 PLP-dependent transferase [Gemmatimonas sp.]MCZ8012001.1 PLP-dependent transferase [Gemmatimonas sp.]MCZ8267319.1 PLP-dependent transferase [Gemmatimonas sp.]